MRVRLWLLLLYLVLPIDLIPDFIPVLGYADDAIIVAVAIRSIARTAVGHRPCNAALARHPRGTGQPARDGRSTARVTGWARNRGVL